MVSARKGSQEPTFSTVGEWDRTDGPDAVGLFEGYGVRFMPAQAWEMDVFLARRSDGSFAARTIAISKPRQNGKSFGARHYCAWMAAVEGAKVLYSAHHGKTVRKMFKMLADLFLGTPDLARMLLPGAKGIYQAAGSEGIYLTNGGCIEFATRTNSGGRGESYDVIIVDEAQELTDEQFDALKPTQLASDSADPQMIYLGTPPNTKCPGTKFRQLHDRAHAGEGGGVWWIEWAATEVGDRYDVDRWYRCMPALGYRIKEDVVADAADTASPDGFAREYLGWWDERIVAVPPAIQTKDWQRCALKVPPPGGVPSYGVKFSRDGERYALCACARYEDGSMLVELVAFGGAYRALSGLVDWITPRSGRCARVAIDGKSKAEALRKKLLDGGVPMQVLGSQVGTYDMADACAMFAEAVESRMVFHFADPGQGDLDAAVVGCPKRNIGASGAWSFDDAPDGTPSIIAEAAALACWGAVTSKRNPDAVQEVW